jgi:hypothetical protein
MVFSPNSMFKVYRFTREFVQTPLETLLGAWALCRQQKSRKGEPMRLLAKQKAD